MSFRESSFFDKKLETVFRFGEVLSSTPSAPLHVCVIRGVFLCPDFEILQRKEGTIFPTRMAHLITAMNATSPISKSPTILSGGKVSWSKRVVADASASVRHYH